MSDGGPTADRRRPRRPVDDRGRRHGRDGASTGRRRGRWPAPAPSVNGRDERRVAETVDALTATGATARGVAGSAADPTVADALVAETVATGDLAAVVNCAGTAEPLAPRSSP